MLSQFATNIDIGPTLLAAAGVAVPTSMQGRSLLPYMNHSGDTGRETLYIENNYDGFAPATNNWQSVQDSRYKYIRYNDYQGVDELYDLQTDPSEIYNVIGAPGSAGTLKRLKRELQLSHGAALSPGETRKVYAIPTTFNDFTLDENNAAINNTGATSTNRVGALTNRGGGRNVLFMVDLPVLGENEHVSEAAFQFLLTNNTGNLNATIGADLWALGIFGDDAQSRALGLFVESETDTDASHIKIADDLLTASTASDQIIRTDDIASDKLVQILAAFYDANPNYDGGQYLYLRLNPDQNLGLTNAGWDLAPVENISHSGDPLFLITAVPEPVTAAYFAFGGLALLARRRRCLA